MAVNKVVYGGSTLIDLTGDNVDPGHVLSGVTFHDKSGASKTGDLEAYGRNLMINTLLPSVVAADRPRLAGQVSNTTVASAASTVTAEHGIRTGVASAAYPYITFGNISITSSNAGMNGLVAGETYTLSFDCDAKLFSGSPSANTSYELRAYLYDNHANSEAFAISSYGTIHVYASSDTSDRGAVVEDMRCEWTFTIPENTTKLYLNIRPSSTTGSLYASGDYIEIRKLKLEKGSVPTAWTPAPEDYANPITTDSLSVTANGTYTASSGTAWDEVTVNVSGGTTPTGTLNITANGTFDVAAYASALVNVPGLEYETGTWEPSSDIARGTISFSNTHTGVPFLVALSDATGTTDGTANTNYTFTFFDFYNAFGVGSPNSASTFRYATATYVYRSSSSIGVGGTHCSTNSDSTSASSTVYSRYWVTPTGFMPYTNSTSRYWRAGRTYKWYAVWKPAA